MFAVSQRVSSGATSCVSRNSAVVRATFDRSCFGIMRQGLWSLGTSAIPSTCCGHVCRCAVATFVSVVNQRDVLSDKGRSLLRQYSVCVREWARAVLAHAERLGAGFRRSAAIGNAANDHSLLAATQRRFAIRNPKRGHLGEQIMLPQVVALPSSGARAWRELLAAILQTEQR